MRPQVNEKVVRVPYNDSQFPQPCDGVEEQLKHVLSELASSTTVHLEPLWDTLHAREVQGVRVELWVGGGGKMKSTTRHEWCVYAHERNEKVWMGGEL